MENTLKPRKLDLCICAKNRMPIIDVILHNIDTYIKDIDCNIILVDGMSSDNTQVAMLNFSKSHKDNCLVLQTTDDSTYIDAYNIALDNCVSKYICWLDSDDIISEDKLKIQIEYLDTHKDIDIVTTSTFFDQNNPLVNTLVHFDNDQLTQVLQEGNHMREVCHFQSAMFRKKCLKIFKNHIYFYPEYVGGFAGEGFLYILHYKGFKFENINTTAYIYFRGKFPNCLSNTIVPIFSNNINELSYDEKKKALMKLFRKYNKIEIEK